MVFELNISQVTWFGCLVVGCSISPLFCCLVLREPRRVQDELGDSLGIHKAWFIGVIPLFPAEKSTCIYIYIYMCVYVQI